VDHVTAAYLAKAGRALDAAEHLLAAGDADFAASRAYYVMLYAADALLNDVGIRLVEHVKVQEALAERYTDTGLLDSRFHRWLVDALETRLIADYSVDAPFPVEDAVRLIDRARDFLEATRAYFDARG
jgi:uncharacterized protein (UPF0332 family)